MNREDLLTAFLISFIAGLTLYVLTEIIFKTEVPNVP